MSGSRILYGPPCLGTHSCFSPRTYAKSTESDVLQRFRAPFTFTVQNHHQLSTLSSLWSLHIWSLAWQSSLIIKWWKCCIVQDNLVFFAHWRIFYIWALQLLLPLSFKDVIHQSDRLSVSLSQGESRFQKSYLREVFSLRRKASVSVRPVSFEGAEKTALHISISAIRRWKEISFHPPVCQQRSLNSIQQITTEGTLAHYLTISTGIAPATPKSFSRVTSGQ